MRSLKLFSLVVACLAWPVAVYGQVAWAFNGTPDKIQTSQSNGSGLTNLWTSSDPPNNSPMGVAISPADGKVYWTDFTARTVSRVGLDGSNQETLFNYSASALNSIAVDGQNSQLYIIGSTTGTNAILRSNFSGTTATPWLSLATTNAWLSFDPVSRFLYYSEPSVSRISRVNVDGAPVTQTVVTLSGTGARGITVDGQGGLYWVDATLDTLNKVNMNSFTGTPLTGTSLLNLRTLTDGTASISNGLGTDGTYLYWADGLTGFRGIYRSDMDGGNGIKIAAFDSTGTGFGVAAIAAVPEPSTIVLCATVPVGIALLVTYRRRQTLKKLEAKL